MHRALVYSLLLILFIGCSKSNYRPNIAKEELVYKGINTNKYDIPIHAVVQDYDIKFEVEDKGNAVKKVRRIVTVLDEDGRHQGHLKLYFDKFKDVAMVKGAIYDKTGEQIKVLNKQDQAEFSSTSSYSLYDEHRVKIFNLKHNSYPYTVVYEYEVEYSGLISWPTWYPLNEDEYVQSSSFEIQIPQGVKVRYQTQNMSVEPEIKQVGENKIYRWSVNEVEPIEVEYYGPNIVEQLPRLQTAPDKFSVEGYSGNMKDWENLGQWYYDLTKGRDELPGSAKDEIDAMLEGLSSKKEKVKTLYNYLQDETRYVSVQLGIGGWQPFEADYVYDNKYGDCKALTNYMQAALKYAGIESYPALIRSGATEPKVNPDFSSNQFNHIILMVPGESDTLWLEATSKVYPFNYIGPGNAGKNVLLIKPSGGELIRTPSITKSQNVTKRNIDVNFDSDGTAQVNTQLNIDGANLGFTINRLAYESPKKRLKWLRNRIDLPSLEILSSDFNEIDQKKRNLTIEYTFKSPHYGTKVGSRFFIPFNRLNQWEIRLPKNVDRQQPVDLKFPLVEIDYYTITIPDGLQIETIPASDSYEVEYGSISYEVHNAGDSKVQVKRKLEIQQPKVPAEDYSELVRFFDKIVEMDKQAIVLKQI